MAKVQRRNFMRAVAAGGALAPQLSGQAAASTEPAKLAATSAEKAAAQVVRFFSARQFATLEKLCGVLMPALGGNPGALEAGAPLFLDFLLGVSPAPRQRSYKQGLDHLEAEARRLFRAAFAEASEEQVGQILKPLLAQWTYDGPAAPLQKFMTEVRADVRTATLNSAEWAQSSNQSRRRRGAGGGYYWHPIDPVQR